MGRFLKGRDREKRRYGGSGWGWRCGEEGAAGVREGEIQVKERKEEKMNEELMRGSDLGEEVEEIKDER